MKKQKRSRWGSLFSYKQACWEIYNERGMKCEKCGVHIREMKWHNFNHLAGRRANFLNKDTIELLCFVCHSNHHGIKEKNGKWLN